MGEKPCDPVNDGKTSHGICPSCLASQQHRLAPTGDQADALRSEMAKAAHHCRTCGDPLQPDEHRLCNTCRYPDPNPDDALDAPTHI